MINHPITMLLRFSSSAFLSGYSRVPGPRVALHYQVYRCPFCSLSSTLADVPVLHYWRTHPLSDSTPIPPPGTYDTTAHPICIARTEALPPTRWSRGLDA